jgi:hypothetical protein
MCGRNRAEGLIRTIGVLVLLAVTATLTLAATAGATPLEYTFSGNNQSWQQAQDPANGPFVSAGFQSSGGNPGGRLTAKDSGPEDGCPDSDPCQLLTFYSPIVPKLGANYGGTASFDLRSQSVDPAFAAEFLLLPEGTEYLDGLIPESLGTDYHHLSIQMSEAANWAVCPYLGGTCSPPSQAQFMALIGATDRVAVIADVGPDGQTGETYDLDNVMLTDGGPQPPPPNHGAPPPKKAKKCKKRKKHHGHRAAAKKCKKKRHRPQRLTTGASTSPARQRS